MVRAHWERLREAKGGFLILHMPTVPSTMHGTQQGLAANVFLQEQMSKSNMKINDKQQIKGKSPVPLRQLTAARSLIGHFGEHAPCLDVREGPVLKKQTEWSQ